MALLYHSSLFLFLCIISIAFSYSLQMPISLCLLKRYINFNVEGISMSPSWRHSNMIKQITNYMMIRGLTCGLYKSTVSSNCSQICAPLAYTLTRVYLHARDVMITCQRPLCSLPSWLLQSRIPPCGSLVFSSNMSLVAKNPNPEAKFILPGYLEVNITIWNIKSRRDPLTKPKCGNAAYLDMWGWRSGGTLFEILRFCGNTPVQNIVSSVHMVFLFWKSHSPYETTASVCISYQPMAIGYARQYKPHSSYLSRKVWWSLVNYFKDELIDRNFYVSNISRIGVMSKNKPGLKLAYISSENMLYRYLAGGVLHRVWSITGNVYYVPQFALLRFSCATINSNSSKRPTLEIFDHPLAQYDVIGQLQRYVIEPAITCNTIVPSLLYNSSIGDLSLLLSADISDYTRIYGVIRYDVPSCPGDYCQNTVKNVSASKGYRFSLTSHNGIIQKRLLIKRADNETGFIAISNFSVRIHGLTHMPCHYGGLFIYELEPLTLVAKICTPWVAKAWYHAVKHVDGTNGIFFNTRPILLVIKSYGDKLFVHLEGYATVSQCSGVVNAAFRDMTARITVSNRGEIIYQLHRHAVRHTNGCFQLSHILTDGQYLTVHQTTLLVIYASGDSGGKVANHTIEASLNADMGASLNTELIRSGYQNSSVVFKAQGMSTKVPSCRIFDVNLGLFDTNPFKFNGSYVVSLLPGRRSYSVGFSVQCFVLGINPVVTMEYIPTLRHSCFQWEEMKRKARMLSTGRSFFDNAVTFPSLICGNLHASYQSPEQSSSTLIILSNPSTKPVCCVLDLDIYVSKAHLPMIHSLIIPEHAWFAPLVLTINRIPLFGKSFDRRLIKRFLKPNLYTTFHRERLHTLNANYYAQHPLMNVWSCSSSPLCNILGNVSTLHDNSSANVRVTGQPWSVNTMTADSTFLQIETRNSDDTFYPMINISFRFREWNSAAVIYRFPQIDKKWDMTQPLNWKLEYSYCFTPYGTCYNFYRKKISSWFEAEQFCRSEGKVLLSTPTDYEWEIIANLFARDPAVIILATTNFLAFINLLKNEVCFSGMIHVCG